MNVREKISPTLIPTRLKVKISSADSYPIGAEKLSLALADVPQFSKLTLHFTPRYSRQTRDAHYAYLNIAYAGKWRRAEPFSPSDIPLFSEWLIRVYPVHRMLRHKVQTQIVEHDLPMIRNWLNKRVDLSAGSDLLTFVLNEERDEFSTESFSKPEPRLR